METTYGPFGNIPVANVSQRLFVLRGANMAITTDQPFTQLFQGVKWDPQTIVANWISGAFNTACAGGIYMGASKTGTVVSPAGTSYAGLTGANTQVNAAIAAFSTTFTTTPILSLTTGNTGALTCDIFIYGFCLD
jgi:hypothetical protein